MIEQTITTDLDDFLKIEAAVMDLAQACSVADEMEAVRFVAWFETHQHHTEWDKSRYRAAVARIIVRRIQTAAEREGNK